MNGKEERSEKPAPAPDGRKGPTRPDHITPPDGPSVRPVILHRPGIQELPPDFSASQKITIEWEPAEYSWGEDEDLYRFLKGGLMAK